MDSMNSIVTAIITLGCYDMTGASGEWGVGQPNNFYGQQFCGALDTFSERLIHGDEACSAQYRFICQLRRCSFHGTSNVNIA